MEIDDFYSVKNSYTKIINLLNNKNLSDNKKFLSLLEQTGWFDFIHQIIKSSMNIVSFIKVKKNLQKN